MLLPHGRDGAQSPSGPLSTCINVWSTILLAPPQVREAGHVGAGCPVIIVSVTQGWAGVVLRPAPQPHLLLVLQPALDRGHVGEEREGQVTSPLPTLSPRLGPAPNQDCLQETRILQRY